MNLLANLFPILVMYFSLSTINYDLQTIMLVINNYNSVNT